MSTFVCLAIPKSLSSGGAITPVKDIGRLDVTVNDAFMMRKMQRVRDVLHHIQRFVLAASELNLVLEIAPSTYSMDI